jgi:hypothetical protein
MGRNSGYVRCRRNAGIGHATPARWASAVKRVRTVTAKCFFGAWIFGWVTAIFAPSVFIVLSELSPLATEKGILSGTIAVADEVAPAAKLGFGTFTAAFMLSARRFVAVRGIFAVALDVLLAVTAMLLVLALLPEQWSRGFGIGLMGTRFAPEATLIYLAGAFLSGLVFSLSEAKCSARTGNATG